MGSGQNANRQSVTGKTLAAAGCQIENGTFEIRQTVSDELGHPAHGGGAGFVGGND